MYYLFGVELLILEYNEGKHFKLFTRLIFSSSFSQVSFGLVSQPWVGRKSYQAIRVRDWNSTGARYLSGIWLFIALLPIGIIFHKLNSNSEPDVGSSALTFAEECAGPHT